MSVEGCAAGCVGASERAHTYDREKASTTKCNCELALSWSSTSGVTAGARKPAALAELSSYCVVADFAVELLHLLRLANLVLLSVHLRVENDLIR